MSDPAAGSSAQPPQGEPGGYAPSVAERFSAFQRAGGLVVPLVTMLLAFFIAGLVVLVTTGHNPLSTYHAIFNGTGLSWFFHPGATPSASRSRSRRFGSRWTRTASNHATRTHCSRPCS